MHYIKQQKDTGRHADEIKASLSSMQATDEPRDLPLPGARIEAEVAVVPAVMVDETRRALLREVATLQSTIDDMKADLADERAGRRADAESHRADVERLVRELGDMQANLSKYKTLLKLYEQGRLTPPKAQ